MNRQRPNNWNRRDFLSALLAAGLSHPVSGPIGELESPVHR